MGGGPVEPDRFAEASLTLRAAFKNDLDAIIRIIQVAFPDDPACDYKFPYREKYSEDFRKWTRSEYEDYIDQPEKFAVLVVTTPVAQDDEEVAVETPIAVGVWDIAVRTKPVGSDHGVGKRRDANPKHMRAFAKTMSHGFKDYFERYGEEQLNLWMLYTLPKFRRRGAGTMLCNWGLKEAIERGNRTLTVMASPMGRRLYKDLGYRKVGSVVVNQVDEDDNAIEISVMEKRNK